VLLALSLSLVLLELVELLVVVVVPVVGRAVGGSTAVEESVSVVGVITELEIERDVTGGVAPEMGSEGVDDNEASESPGEIRVMAKAGLVSAESPYKTMR